MSGPGSIRGASGDHYRGGQGQPLVLLHALASTWRDWEPVLGALTAERDVLAPRLAGHYDAEPLPPGVAPTIEALATAVEAQLDAAGLEAPDLAGNSLGAWVAFELAQRGRARSVVGIGPAGGWSGAEGVALANKFRRDRAMLRWLYRPALLMSRFRAGRRALWGEYVARPERVTAAESRYAVTAFARCPCFHDFLEANGTPDGGLLNAAGLEEVDCPVLLVFGDDDKITPPHQARYFLDRIPGARAVGLAGAGHVPMGDDPQLVARTILDFSGLPEEDYAATAAHGAHGPGDGRL